MTVIDALLARPFFSYADATACGVTSNDLRAALHAGRIVRLKRGWYSAATFRWEVQRHAALARVEALDHRGTRVSHVSALAVLGLPVHEPDLGAVHLRLLGPGCPVRRRHLRVHEPLRRDGGQPVARALMETAARHPQSALMAADEALRRGLTTPEALSAWAARLAGDRGSAKVAMVRRLCDARRESPAESRMALTVLALGWATVPQVQVRGRQGSYRVDAALVGEWVALEYDGEDKYGEGLSTLLREKRREDDIRSQGWEVVRVTRHLLDHPDELRELIDRAVRRARRRHGSTPPPGRARAA